MNLVELYSKLPPEKHKGIKVIGNLVIYDSGTVIYQCYLDGEGNLVPADQASKDVLKKLGSM